MKTVYLIRHAKSSWDHAGLRDHQRPLNERGLRDAPFMAKMLKEKGAAPDAIFSSPAVRAITTATFFKDALGLEGEDVFLRDQIYEAMPQTILHFLQTLPEKYTSVMLFGHNPTFTSVANMFTDNYIGNVPTCGIIHLEAEVDNWPSFKGENGSLKVFHFPKQYL